MRGWEGRACRQEKPGPEREGRTSAWCGLARAGRAAATNRRTANIPEVQTRSTACTKTKFHVVMFGTDDWFRLAQGRPAANKSDQSCVQPSQGEAAYAINSIISPLSESHKNKVNL